MDGKASQVTVVDVNDEIYQKTECERELLNVI